MTAFGLANMGQFVVHFQVRGGTYTLHSPALNSALLNACVQSGDSVPIGYLPAADVNRLVAIVRTASNPAP